MDTNIPHRRGKGPEGGSIFPVYYLDHPSWREGAIFPWRFLRAKGVRLKRWKN